MFIYENFFKVTSLRQSVIERDRRISELSERHSHDLATIREAQLEALQSNRHLTTTVDHVLKVSKFAMSNWGRICTKCCFIL